MHKRITPSLVISLIALSVALGGASYAALKVPRNSVGATQLKKNSVTTPKLRNSSVNSAKVKNGSLRVVDFSPGQIPGATWYAQRKTSTLFEVTGTYQPVVTTVKLPAGFYLLGGRANVISGPSTSTLTCSLGFDAAQTFTVAGNSVLPLSLQSAVKLKSPAKLSLFCVKVSGDPFIAQSTVIATRVPKLVGLPE